ncbi:hypothetical protein HFO61_30275 [Rhizobium leguminosarum]|uniref:hypothetical protein n=1 Tax=Rhizobium leguminosarum TaxID=384 RepID=UPI001C959C8D|nr:hypothetical protein [Rhizobium leguminosarum]MBY5551034.1 hypothetical protein [Rhizobium leguminosarum]
MSGNDDKWERLKIEKPHMWQRRQALRETVRASIERVRQARGEADEFTMAMRVEMAREFVGERAQDIEIGDDGSVTVNIAPLN